MEASTIPDLTGDPLENDPRLKAILGTPAAKSRRKAGTSDTKRQEKPNPIAAKKLPTDADITKCVTEILSVTAVVHALPQLPSLQCEFCKKHILDQAPDTAKDLVALSKDYPFLRSALIGVTRFFGGLSTLSTLTELYDASVMHHAPLPKGVEPVVDAVGHIKYPNMPPRNEDTVVHLKLVKPHLPRRHDHAHSEASEGTIASPTTFEPSPN